ncbi:MAG: hypothetical protein PVJ89_05955 [Planctomycetota bacterium]|jgi:hypothetical protein
MNPPTWLLTLAAVAHLTGAAPAQEPPSPAPQEAKEETPSLKVFTAGASVSAGYGLSAELRTDGDIPLSVFLSATLSETGRARVQFVGEGERWFFNDPYKSGARLVDAAVATEADAVVGVDFLFWYAFGANLRSAPRRSRGLEVGLAELDRLSCPLVIGDLPDISHALDGKGPFGGPVVNRRLFPSDEERAAMNRAIRAWAAERDNVLVVPLADLMRRYVESEPVRVRDLEWAVEGLDEALQKDLLHPNARGTTWVAMVLADALVRLPGFEDTDFRFDEGAARARIDALTAESRERRMERERRRAERKAEREERARKRDDEEGDAPVAMAA